jgi:hypothetical protein
LNRRPARLGASLVSGAARQRRLRVLQLPWEWDGTIWTLVDSPASSLARRSLARNAR